jgi:hypothetical protein
MGYLWELYFDAIKGGEISYRELEAWARLKRLDLTSYEVEAIIQINQEHLEALKPPEEKETK